MDKHSPEKLSYIVISQIKNSGWFLGLVILVYLLIAYFSIGFHHYDEHYQILEFAHYKLGLTPRDHLAWEFEARIRPTIQPTIALGIFKFLTFCGIRDRFIWALVLRVLSALLAIVTLKKFIDSILSEILPETVPLFIFLSYFLWFLPYINVRYSSENWSGLFFIMAITLIRSPPNKSALFKNLLIGSLLGLSTLFRYQAAILVVASLFWLYFIAKMPIKNIGLILVALFSVLLLGVGLDSWFYGEWVITMVNYFKSNIVQNVASTYGTLPWYQYSLYIVTKPITCIGYLILLSLVYLIYIDSKHILVWAILPFLIVHSAIPHKELRFLFELANFTPAILLLAWNKIPHINIIKKTASVWALAFLLVLNTTALFAASFKGAGDAKLVIADYIQHKYAGQRVSLMLSPNANPYDEIPPKNDFYRNPDVLIHPIEIYDDHVHNKDTTSVKLLAICNSDTTNEAIRSFLAHSKLVTLKKSMPIFSECALNLYDKKLARKIITLYKFK
ncbi:hypothetical protein [Mucilaginibacter sp. UYCu711]|uniref:hypothetical protein n=1 Tax=Mucilaginibacter sp. UYCu711 TaxID=3156339 RepID=UPI003D25FB06